ncbi:MAG: hypothetical protein ACYTHM_25070, partial [Planctomycetota bacterium]
MSDLTLECEHCGSPMAVDPSLAGKRVRCPECEEVVEVPEEAEAESEPARPRMRKGTRRLGKGGTTLRDRKGTT